jgi:hypothetical protein
MSHQAFLEYIKAVGTTTGCLPTSTPILPQRFEFKSVSVKSTSPYITLTETFLYPNNEIMATSTVQIS